MSVFISLTTVPERLAFWQSVKLNLESLLNQNTTREYKVVLNVPFVYKNRDIEYVIPKELTELAAANPKLIINRITSDRGPIEKVIGCFNIATDPEDTIIALDDDHFYHEDMLEYIMKKQEQYPYAVIGFRGDQILEKREFMHNGLSKYVLLGTHAFFPLKKDYHGAVPGHWHSVTYKRKFIENDFFSETYLGVAASDDHIISYYLLSKGIEYIMVAWDKEDNFIPVNDMPLKDGKPLTHGKPSHHFPIKYQLGFPDGTAGFAVFRKKSGDHLGFIREDFSKGWDFSCRKVYIQKPYTEADEIKPPVLIAPAVEAPPESPYIDQRSLSTNVTCNVLPDDFTYPPLPPIITLTTIPSRLKAEYDAGIKQCISSLMDQTYPLPYEIHFNIPNVYNHTGEEYIIPQWLQDLSGDKLKIFRVDDFGPITKLYPTIERVTNPDTIIVVVDDDLVYHNEMLEDQVKNQFKFDRSIVGYDGIDCWQSIFNDVRDHFITAHRLNIKVKVLQHYKSISYKRSFIESDFKAFMDEYYEWNDDLLMAAYMGSKDIKRIFTYNEKYTPNYNTIDEWRTGNAAITFPLLRHTSHEGEEGCTLYRQANRPHFKRSPYSSNLIEKNIP